MTDAVVAASLCDLDSSPRVIFLVALFVCLFVSLTAVLLADCIIDSRCSFFAIMDIFSPLSFWLTTEWFPTAL